MASPQLEGEAPRDASLKSRLLRGAGPRILTSLLIAVGFIWLLARGGLPLVPPAADLARIPLWATVAFMALTLASSFMRSYRWVFLLRPIAPHVSAERVVGIGLVGFGAIFFAPLRMGEIVRPFLLAQDREVSFTQAAGTIFAERVIDGVVVTVATSISLLLAAMVSPLPKRLGDLPLPLATVPAAVATATAAFCGLFIAMTAFYVARDWARRVVQRLLGPISPKVAAWLERTLEQLAQSLSFLPSRKNLSAFAGSTIVAWFLSYFAQLLLLRASGLPASLAQAIAMVGILGLGVVVPAGPGLFGAYQIASFSALCLFFPIEAVRAQGAALVFIAYVGCLAMSLLETLIGAVMLWRTRPRPALG